MINIILGHLQEQNRELADMEPSQEAIEKAKILLDAYSYLGMDANAQALANRIAWMKKQITPQSGQKS